MVTNRKFYYLLLCLLCVVSAAAQYSVSGGEKTPLLAFDNTNYRTKVFLVYGTENLQISYTSQSTSHKWYRYKTKVDDLNPEAVASVQNGATSTISNVEPGYGYYVDENGAMRYYVWIIDYSKYKPEIRNFNISSNVDECEGVRFESDATIDDIPYYLPTGTAATLKRQFVVSYETLVWNENLKQFSSTTYIDTISTNPFSTTFPAPLTDTEFSISGDMFAEYFGHGMEVFSSSYQAKALEVHAYMTQINPNTLEETDVASGEFLAPAQMRFSAYANIPTASLFVWTITNNENPENPLVRYTDESVEYTFKEHGSFTVRLEVSDRTGACVNTDNKFTVTITETEVKIPNAFSPGCTPGVNDYFVVSAKSVVKFDGWIFNRWGSELYHWTDPSQGWDGKYRGKYVAPGAYYYLIQYTGTDGKTHKRTGDVNVFRSKKEKTEINEQTE